MSIRVQDSGTLRTLTGMQVKQSGITREIRTVRVQDGGTLRTVAVFAEDLAINALGTEVAGASSSLTTTTPAAANVSGGLSPFTYSWVRLTNGGGNGSTASSPTNASTNFTKTGLLPGNEFSDTWQVTVTDSTGATVSDTVSVTFTYNN